MPQSRFTCTTCLVSVTSRKHVQREQGRKNEVPGSRRQLRTRTKSKATLLQLRYEVEYRSP